MLFTSLNYDLVYINENRFPVTVKGERVYLLSPTVTIVSINKSLKRTCEGEHIFSVHNIEHRL